MNERNFPRGYKGEEDEHLPIATRTWAHEQEVIEKFKGIERGATPFLFGSLPDETGGTCHLSYSDDAGIFTVAGSRSGKGVSLIIPNLLNYSGPVLVLDPKAENASKTAHYRARVFDQNIVALDPFSVTDLPKSTFNPLVYFDPEHDEFVDDITDLADALIVRSHGNADPHWDESARSVFKMLLMYIVIDHEKDDRNLVWLRTLLLNGQTKSEQKNYQAPEPKFTSDMTDEDREVERRRVKNQTIADHVESSFTQLLKNFKEHDNHIIAGTAQRLLDAGERERGSIISTAQRHTDFLDSKPIQSVLKTNSFDLSQLRQSSVYLILPEGRMAAQSRWLRMVITLVLRRVQSEGLKKADDKTNSLMMVLDECASLGYMEAIERSMA